MNLSTEFLYYFFSECFCKIIEVVEVGFNTILDSMQEATINQAILLKTPDWIPFHDKYCL